MRAILLAAGRGRRLGRSAPKCLINIEGRTLLERHLVNLAESGVDRLTIVTGFEQGMIEDTLSYLRTPLQIELVRNERYVHGSIVSLHVAADRLIEGGLWMDADVLYPAALLRRLVASPHENCILLDAGSEETGEEMMVGVRNGRALKIARRVGKDWDLAGETVGFARVGPEGGRVMQRVLAEEVSSGRIDQEYEAAMDRAFQEVHFGVERVDDLPWTEIDFEEDIEKATRLAREL
jgi:choline kinase